MLKKVFIFVFLLINMLCFSEENVLIQKLRQDMIRNINLINDNKNLFFSKSFFDNTADTIIDTSNDFFSKFKSNLGVKIYFFNNKKTMFKEYKNKSVDIQYVIVQREFVNLPVIKDSKIYISEIICYGNNVYYFIGVKKEDRYMLFLFEVADLSDDNLLLINAIGESIFSNKTDDKLLKKITDKILSSRKNQQVLKDNSIYKFKFFQYHNVYYLVDKTLFKN